MRVNKPAEDTAAAVNWPEIAEATLNPANTSMTMNRTMMPRGVLIIPIMEPVALLAPLPMCNITSHAQHTKARREMTMPEKQRTNDLMECNYSEGFPSTNH